MDFESFVAKLKVMERKNPEEFNLYMNKLKVSKPNIYNRVKVHFDEEEDVFSTETPFEINVPKDEPNELNWAVLIILFAVFLFAGTGAYFYVQNPEVISDFLSFLSPDTSGAGSSEETVSGLSIDITCTVPNRILLTITNEGVVGATFTLLELIENDLTIGVKIYGSPDNEISSGGAVIVETFDDINFVNSTTYTIRLTTSEGALTSDCVAG